METEGSLSHSQVPPTCPCPEPVHTPTSHFLKIHLNIINPSTPRSPQWFLPSGFPTKTLRNPPPPHPYAPHAQPISFFSILSPAQYWVRSTNHLAPRYAVSSILRYLLPPMSKYSPHHHVLKHIQKSYIEENYPELYLQSQFVPRIKHNQS
jgi:hypothetical protein